MEKFKVKLPAEEKFGKLAHLYFEPKVANRLYTTVRNCVEGKIDFKNRYKDVDPTKVKLDLLNRFPILHKLENNPFDLEYLSQYKVYRNTALKLSREREAGSSYFMWFFKFVNGFAYIQDKLIEKEEAIISYYAAQSKIRSIISANDDRNKTLNDRNKILEEIKKSAQDRDYTNLSGAPKALLMIEHTLMKMNKLYDYFNSVNGNQSSEAKKREKVYGVKGSTIISKKNLYLSHGNATEGKRKDDNHTLFKDKKQLATAIIYVQENLNKEDSLFDEDLLNTMIEKWKDVK